MLLLLLLRLLLLLLVMVVVLRRLLLRRRRLVLRLVLVLLLLLQCQRGAVVRRMGERRQRPMGVVAVGTVTGVRHCVGGRHIAVQARGLTIDGRSTLTGDNFCHHNLSS